jgi:hypothetical protein
MWEHNGVLITRIISCTTILWANLVPVTTLS